MSTSDNTVIIFGGASLGWSQARRGRGEGMMEAGLPEELLLLALHDEKGSVIPAAAPVLNGALVGAALMELALRGRLSENPDRTVSVDPKPTGDAILDEMTATIARSDQSQTERFWVERLSGQMPDLKDRVLEGLVASGVLERHDRRFLWVFPTRGFLVADGAAEQDARTRIRRVVLDGEVADRRTAALIALMQACNLIDEVFAPHERTQARRRLAELTGDEQTTATMFGDGLEALLLAALVGATTLYTYRQLRSVDDLDVGDDGNAWFIHDSSSSSGASEGSPVEASAPAESSSGGGWFGSGWFSGGSDSGSGNDNSSSGGGDSGGSDFGGGGDFGGSSS